MISIGKLLDKKAEALVAGRGLNNSVGSRTTPLSTSAAPNIAASGSPTSPVNSSSSSPTEGKSGIKKVID